MTSKLVKNTPHPPPPTEIAFFMKVCWSKFPPGKWLLTLNPFCDSCVCVCFILFYFSVFTFAEFYCYILWESKLIRLIWFDLHCFDLIWSELIWYDMMWYDMIWYDHGMIWYDMIWFDMIWFDLIWYDRPVYDMIIHDLILFLKPELTYIDYNFLMHIFNMHSYSSVLLKCKKSFKFHCQFCLNFVLEIMKQLSFLLLYNDDNTTMD